jgi:hypothetical protein
LIGVFDLPLATLGIPLLTAPLLWWLLARQCWNVRRVMSVFLDKLAKELGLKKL